MSAAVEQAVIAAMLAGAGTAAEIRAATGLSAADVKAGIQRARFKGKILFDRLKLAPSQLMAAQPDPAAVCSSAPLGQAGEADDESAGGKGGGADVRPAPPPVSNEIASPDPIAAARTGVADGPCSGDEGGAATFDAAPLDVPITGAALAAEVEDWLAKTGTKAARFTLGCGNNKAYLHGLRKAARPSEATVAKVRGFLAAHPDGIESPGRAPALSNTQTAKRLVEAPPAPPPASVADAVRQEAEQAGARRRVAQSTGSVSTVLAAPPPKADAPPRHEPEVSAGPARRKRIALPKDLSPAETIQSALAETPKDVVEAVYRRHPQLWGRCVTLGRVRGELPAVVLYDAIAQGLTAIEARLVREAGIA